MVTHHAFALCDELIFRSPLRTTPEGLELLGVGSAYCVDLVRAPSSRPKQQAFWPLLCSRDLLDPHEFYK